MKINKTLLYIITFSLLLRSFYLLFNWPLWWDSHVYVSIGKYLFSGGQLGIWESFRPLVHPLLLGFSWKIGLDPFIVGKILDVVFSLLAIYLVYVICDKIFQNNTISALSALIFSLNPIFLTFTGLILSDPFAIVFGLLGLLMIIGKISRWKLFLSGIFLGLSFMTRFPQGMWFGVIFVTLLINKRSLQKKLKEVTLLSLGFLIPVIPFLIFNYNIYNNPFHAFISGSWIVTTATWLYGSGLFFYFTEFFMENPVLILFIPYIYFFFREKHWQDNKRSIIFFITLLTILYFFQVPRKEGRYLITILPLMAILASWTIFRIYHLLKNKIKPVIEPRAFLIIITVLLLIPIPTAFNIERMPTFNQEIMEIIQQYNIEDTILASNPAFVSFLDLRIITLDGIDFADIVYQRNLGKYELIFINDCDLVCHPNDKSCLNKRKTFLELLASQNKEVFRKKIKECQYVMYTPK